MLLDQEGVEIDGPERRDGDTCLHKAVRYVNSLDKSDWKEGEAVVDILIDAGCDPRYAWRRHQSTQNGTNVIDFRIRNKAKLRPFDLVDPRNTELRGLLRKAEFTIMAGNDVVEEEEEEGDNGEAGSASDSE